MAGKDQFPVLFKHISRCEGLLRTVKSGKYSLSDSPLGGGPITCPTEQLLEDRSPAMHKTKVGHVSIAVLLKPFH